MNDVEMKAILATEPYQQLNGFELRLIGARGKIGCIPPPIGIPQWLHRRVNRASQFCVHEKGETRLGDKRKRRFQLLLVDHHEAVTAGVDEKAFETENACTCERK